MYIRMLIWVNGGDISQVLINPRCACARVIVCNTAVTNDQLYDQRPAVTHAPIVIAGVNYFILFNQLHQLKLTRWTIKSHSYLLHITYKDI